MEDYAAMQHRFYNQDAAGWTVNNRDAVVGTFDAHNSWGQYSHLFSGMDDLKGKRVLDFGCGPGRNLVKYAKTFGRIDGVDISEVNLEKARVWIEHNGLAAADFSMYQCNGMDLSDIPSDTYDIVMSTICMQHICVYDIRYGLLKEFLRVLKPGGCITIQMGYGGKRPGSVDYYANNVTAGTTNGHCDNRVEDPAQLRGDVEKIGYVNFSHVIADCGPGDLHDNWIYFRAFKPQNVVV